ncbi:MAG TPA: murein biosynthesis integral membrane protein MurJ [Nitrolancea sp.]|nr:murein biosynthesis integral membrane protein MurJ [Nitrolancea sp.]
MSTVSRRPRRITPTSIIAERSVAANATIVAAAYVVSRVLGLLREVLIARQFGTSPNYDAYVAAFKIPDLLFLVVMSGAFGSAFIPVFGGFLGRGEHQRAWRLASSVLTYTIAVLLGGGIVVFIFASPVMRYIVAPGLAPPQQELATNLTRLLLFSPLLLGIGAAGKGMLEAHDAFTVSAIAPILYNVGIIIGAIFFAPHLGVYGLAVGVIGGAFGHASIQMVALFRRGLRFNPSFSRQVDGLAQVARLMGPRLLGQAAFQVNFIVMTNFASRLGASRVSALNYANQLFMLPHGILALSISTVIFPTMARQFELGLTRELRRTLSGALAPLLFLTIPASIGLFMFRVSIVQILFQFGSFSSQSTDLVANALKFFSLGLLAFAVVETVTRAFYAMHDTRTPVIASLVTIAVNVALSWILAPRLGEGGLALSIALTTTLEMTILLLVLIQRTGNFEAALYKQIGKMLLAGLALAAASRLLAPLLARATDPIHGHTLVMYPAFFFTLAAVTSTYLAASYYLRIPAMQQMVSRVLAKLRRS